METLQDIQDTDVHGSSSQNLDGQSQTRLQETEQALQSLQLRAQELFQELNELEVLASRQHAVSTGINRKLNEIERRCIFI